MAERGVRPDYTIGTITLVAGSLNFTTTGASLQSAVIQGGDTIITKGGSVLIIDEITGQDSGTLIFPCPADDAGADLPTLIRFQPDGSRIQGAARDFIARWGQTGNVDAFAALAGYVNAVPVFTGAGTMKLVSLSDIQMSDPHGNLAQLAALAKAANHFVIMGADGSVTLKPISELTDAIENNRLGIVGLGNAKFDKPSGTTSQYVRGDGGISSLDKAAVGLGNVENIAPSGMWAAMGGVDNAAYKKLPGGLIFQTGSVNRPETDYRINFPTAFPTACMWVKARSTYPIEGIQYLGIATTGKTASGVDIRVRNMVAGGTVQPQGSVPVEWFAMGY